MPDPIDELEGFTMSTVNPLPPGDVRRRGDRIRRRNNAVAAIGGLVVIAAIATPLAVIAGHHGSSDSVPPTRTVEWTHTVPAAFPLTDGMPAATQTRPGFEQQDVDVCANQAWSTDGATDARQATYTGETEGGSDRVLAVYPTERDAELALEALDANTQACAAETEDAKQRWVTVVPSDVGQGSLTYANHMSDAGDMFVVQVVRVGNALLRDTTYAMGGGDPQVVQQTADLLEENSAEVVASMCVFSATPCETPPA
jgi:hypothetical protein